MGEIHGRHTGAAVQKKYDWLVPLAADQYPLGRAVERDFLKRGNAAASQYWKRKSRRYNTTRCHRDSGEKGNYAELDPSPNEHGSGSSSKPIAPSSPARVDRLAHPAFVREKYPQEAVTASPTSSTPRAPSAPARACL